MNVDCLTSVLCKKLNVACVEIRAQSARPCVLFFDEFDSLAPRLVGYYIIKSSEI